MKSRLEGGSSLLPRGYSLTPGADRPPSPARPRLPLCVLPRFRRSSGLRPTTAPSKPRCLFPPETRRFSRQLHVGRPKIEISFLHQPPSLPSCLGKCHCDSQSPNPISSSPSMAAANCCWLRPASPPSTSSPQAGAERLLC